MRRQIPFRSVPFRRIMRAENGHPFHDALHARWLTVIAVSTWFCFSVDTRWKGSIRVTIRVRVDCL